MSASDPVRVGIIGYGFMGRTHARAYQRAQRDGYAVKLVAIADSTRRSFDDANRSPGNLEAGGASVDLSGVGLPANADELLADGSIDLVSICTHTDTHVELAIRAINARKHVLVEKPVAIDPLQVQRLADAARATDRACMPAMCMRYWPAWVKIHAMITNETYGRARSAEFHRLGSRPRWAEAFYADEARSGGALYDLHIHDTDFIVHCFGLPGAVTTSGDGLHLSTIYHYDNGPVHVLAQGAWDHQPGVGLRMRCTIVCERATIDFDIGRDEQLVVHQGDRREAVTVGDLTGYDGEIRAMLDATAGKSTIVRTTMDDAARVARLLDEERKSMETKTTRPVSV